MHCFGLLRRETWYIVPHSQHNHRGVTPILRFCRPDGTNIQPNITPRKWPSETSKILFDKSEALIRTSYEKIGGLVRTFDHLLGISEVQRAQASVKKAEDEFMETRRTIQLAKTDLDSVQEKLGDVRRKLDRIPRDDERYLTLATEEHKILLEEKKLKNEYERIEALERDRFAQLSGAVRDSHEKERARVERTKHWSVIGSVGGAALGILGSSLMNYVRLKQIKNSVKDTGNTVMVRTDELSDLIKAQDSQLETKTMQLRESLSAHSQLLQQKLEELGSVLNFFTLNVAAEPLKEFGVHMQRPQGRASGFANGQPVTGKSEQQGRAEDMILNLMSSIDSLKETMKLHQLQFQGDYKSLQQNIEKLGALLQTEERTKQNQYSLVNSIEREPVTGSSGVEKTTPSQSVQNNEWWAKASTLSSALCFVLTASVLLYELFK